MAASPLKSDDLFIVLAGPDLFYGDCLDRSGKSGRCHDFIFERTGAD